MLAALIDGREVPLVGEVLRRFVVVAREWVRRNPWSPLPGPQTMAFETEADIIGYGGAAGGGKTDLACGKAITRHIKVMMLRRVGTELQGILDRLEELVGDTTGKNGQLKVWKRLRHDGVKQQIEWASLPNAGDERGFQGRPHDLLVFDEAANFLESQVRFLLGWLRTTVKGQKCQALLTFNPPTSAEGQWIIAFFAPWLDDTHPNPALPGELRWFATIKGKDFEVPDGRAFVIGEDGVSRDYGFDPKAYRGKDRTKIVKPMSRTFIPSRITDNPYLEGTGYMAMLQALPEPLRSQMLNGDFKAGMSDDIWQVIPSAWVDLAEKRWQRWADAHPDQKPGDMDSVGVDVARGGKDETVIARRHGPWFDVPLAYPGADTPDGHSTAAHVMLARKNRAPIHLDVIGVGGSPFDIIRTDMQAQITGVDVRNKTPDTDKTGHMGFFNLRSCLWWKMREWLDPANNTGAMLPKHSRLRADLCAPKWSPSGRLIKVESKEDIEDRIGRSPDYGTAYILGLIDTPKQHLVRGVHVGSGSGEYDPYAALKPGGR